MSITFRVAQETIRMHDGRALPCVMPLYRKGSIR
jgi:hypothetical protein